LAADQLQLEHPELGQLLHQLLDRNNAAAAQQVKALRADVVDLYAERDEARKVARQISKLSLDWGISTDMNTDSLDPTTYSRTILTERKPTLAIDPQTTPKATQDDFGLFFAGTSAAMSIVLGSGVGRVCTITIPNIQRKTADFGERGVITTTETTFRINGNSDSGENSIAIAFT
jgi:hypothetical protein